MRLRRRPTRSGCPGPVGSYPSDVADAGTLDAPPPVPASAAPLPAAPVPAEPATATPAPRGGSRRLTRAGDVACFLLACLGLPAAAHGLLHGWDGYPHWLRVADGVFGGIALLATPLRRRHPLGYAVYVLVVACFSTLASFTPLIAAFMVAVHRRWQVSVPVAVLLSATAVPALLFYPGRNPFWSGMVASTALTLAFTAWGMFTRARRQLVTSLRDRAERAEAEQALLADRARRAERHRIAGEMHDVLAHRLSLLSVHAGALEFRADAAPADVARAAGVIRANVHEALEELRDVVAVLRDDELERPERPQPTMEDLPGLVAECRRAGTPIRDLVRLADSPAPRSLGRTVYRIVQEGLTNVRKHAPASGVDLTVSGAPGLGVTVSLRSRLSVDRVADPMPGSGSGLVGLAERVELTGGWLRAAVDGGDFVVRGWLPWPEDEQR